MPAASFFKNLSLFVAEGFLNVDSSLSLQAEMKTAAFEKATVVKDGREGILDEKSRKVSAVHVAEDTWSGMRQRLRDLKPRLEEHFGIPLSRKCHGPDFLTYRPGGFYGPHRDASEGSPEHIRSRRVSVVLFLNSQSKEPSPDTFGGGGLAFYGLMDGPQWEKLAFTLEPTAGLLVAFRSDVLHEVQPVTFGERHTIVTWFTAEQEPQPAQVDSEVPVVSAPLA